MTRPVQIDVIEIEAQARAMRAAYVNALFASWAARLRGARPQVSAARA